MTVIECITPNACDTVADGDGGKPGAAIESPFPDARHTIGDVDGSQEDTVPESTISDESYPIINQIC